jgi:hypothetical protein
MEAPWDKQKAIDEAFLQANEIYAFLGVWSDDQLIENRDRLKLFARATMRLLIDHTQDIDRDPLDVEGIIGS